jgi:arylsulfatase A-like enzyme
VKRLRAHLRLALAVGVVGGLVLGAREALVVLYANAFVQAGQYFWLYAAVPVLAWLGFAVTTLALLALVCWPLRDVDKGKSQLWLYAAALAALGALSIAVPSMARITGRMREVGLTPDTGTIAALWALALIATVGAAAMTGAAADWYAARVQRPLRWATRVGFLIALVLVWPVARFFATDWIWAGAPPASAAGEQPNLVLISIDTLRADHLGSYGDAGALTPNLDRFAAEGIVFEHAITSSPWTLPAMASLFTAQYPRHHRAGDITNRRDPLGRSALPPESWTLTRTLRERSYWTQAIVTNPYLALRYGLGTGFDAYENVSIQSEAFIAFQDTTALRLLEWWWPGIRIGDRGETVSTRAVRALTQLAPARAPFFLWLHYIDPHPPYSRAGVTRHKSFRGDTSFASEQSADDFALTSPDVARLRSGEIRPGPEQKDAIRALYRAEVAAVDTAIGRVLDALDALRLRDRTLVIVVADHGEEFWEHGGVEHGHTVYEELIRVPLLLRWPGRLPAGTRVHPVVRMVDIAPTALELLGLPIPDQRDGTSVLSLIEGRQEPMPRVALVENMLFADERVGLRTAQHKYIRWETGKEEVYDLRADPREHLDLAASDGSASGLRQLFAALDAAQPATTAPQPVLDARTEAAMRALGYLP